MCQNHACCVRGDLAPSVARSRRPRRSSSVMACASTGATDIRCCTSPYDPIPRERPGRWDKVVRGAGGGSLRGPCGHEELAGAAHPSWPARPTRLLRLHRAAAVRWRWRCHLWRVAAVVATALALHGAVPRCRHRHLVALPGSPAWPGCDAPAGGRRRPCAQVPAGPAPGSTTLPHHTVNTSRARVALATSMYPAVCEKGMGTIQWQRRVLDTAVQVREKLDHGVVPSVGQPPWHVVG